MNIKIINTLSVCQDCLIWIANADDSGLDLLTDSDADEIRQSRDTGIDNLTANGEQLVASNEEYSFSWSNCDICNALPGNRYEVTVLSA